MSEHDHELGHQDDDFDQFIDPEDLGDDEEPLFFRCLPGYANECRVRAWKCDECNDLHIVIYFRCDPPGDLAEQGEQPYYAALDMSEKAMRYLLKEAPDEMATPAPGLNGSISLPMARF